MFVVRLDQPCPSVPPHTTHTLQFVFLVKPSRPSPFAHSRWLLETLGPFSFYPGTLYRCVFSLRNKASISWPALCFTSPCYFPVPSVELYITSPKSTNASVFSFPRIIVLHLLSTLTTISSAGSTIVSLRYMPLFSAGRTLSNTFATSCEPVWPSDKALGWWAEGPRFESASALLSLQKGFGLWTLSCYFVPHN